MNSNNINISFTICCQRLLFVFAFCFACAEAYSSGSVAVKGNRSDIAVPFMEDPLMESHLKTEAATGWIASAPVRFKENKGQMTDVNHKPVPQVFFKASSPGMDVYLTDKGLTYVFIKYMKDEKGGKEQEETSGSESPKGEKKRKMEMAWINLELESGSIRKENMIKEGQSKEDFNYFYAHCPKGIYGVKEYEKITVREVYPGIDWVLYGSNKTGMKYDFVVHPGADPADIRLIYESKNLPELGNEGNLLVQSPLGKLTEKAPYSYIRESGEEVASQFQITDQQSLVSGDKHYYQTSINFKFQISNFKSQTLIIDPQLNWSTFYGGNGMDGAMSIDLDTNGNIFVAGYTASAGFPSQLWPGAYNDTVYNGNWDAFILEFSSAGILNWASYYGGSGGDAAYAIACDNNGNVYVTGRTNSANFPINSWAGAYIDSSNGGGYDAYIVRFSNAGLLTWSTYYGGGGNDEGYSIFCNGSGDIYITGLTSSSDFNVYSQAGAHNQNVFGGGGNDAFILQFSNTGALNWATLYGGGGDDRGHSIFCDGAGNIYVTGRAGPGFPTHSWPGAYNNNLNGGGHDAFILRFANSGALTWATYYGGNGWDEGNSITCDRMGNIYVTGLTSSTNFSIFLWTDAYYQDALGGGRDAFILRFADTGVLTWATYYGGSGNEYWYNQQANVLMTSYKNIVTDNCGNVYVSFNTESTNLYTFQDSGCGQYYDPSHNNSPTFDIFLIKFSSSGVVLWATYFGGNSWDFRESLTLDNSGNLFVTGEWMGTSGYPLVNPGNGAYVDSTANGFDDIFIAKFTPVPAAIDQSQINSTNCSCNGSASVIVNCGTATYLWNTGAETQNITALCPGSYHVVVSNVSCTPQSDTLYFTISGNTPVTSVSITEPSCNGGNDGSVSVNPTGGSPPYTYSWSSGGTGATENNLAAGTYTVAVTDANGCLDSIHVTVAEPDEPSLTLSGDTIICYGDSVTLTAAAQGGTPPYTYTWNPGAMNGSSVIVFPSDTFTYSVVMKDANNCPALSQTLTVSVIPLPDALILSQGPFCIQSQLVTLSASIMGGYWSGTGIKDPDKGLFDPSVGIGKHTVSYSVSEAGCVYTDSRQIEVISSKADFKYQEIPCTNQVQFINESSDTLFSHWDFGDGTLSSEGNPKHTYYANENYTVILIINPDSPCADTIKKVIPFENDTFTDTLFIPNVFTPNGDGKNDYFEIIGGNNPCTGFNKLKIFNRWGIKVFEIEGNQFKWDGTSNGNILTDGVYFYVLEGEEVKKSGSVVLLR